MDAVVALERERLTLERYRIDNEPRTSLSPPADLLILKDFVESGRSENDLAPVGPILKLISSMADAGTMTAATAENLSADIVKDALKQTGEAVKQIAVKTASNLIDKYIHGKSEKGPPSHANGSLATAIVEVKACETSRTCSCPLPPGPSKPSLPPHPHKKLTCGDLRE
ncbi:hypothetical protein [Caballeronia sp. DA-9]|uniref:hypothetical protein n=1 Tax=Caballeronia sp. DA-9 TaxID=3436237 RepID=UPI003F67A58F